MEKSPRRRYVKGCFFDGCQTPAIWRIEMTTLAPPPPHLARLFSRLDAADASDPFLRLAFEFWRTKRGSRLMPTASDVSPGPDSIVAHVFAFQRPQKTDEWEVTGAGSEAAILLGLGSSGKKLSKLLAPRIAARLRRLFETVAETAEPLAAAFELLVKQGRRQWIEVLAAPLSSDGRHVDGIYGGIVCRAEAASPITS